MSMTSNKQKRQLFPEKLWELVNSQQNSGIRWSPNNSKCIEIERSKLERFLQTKFRSQNFDSFIRQLHFYGFKKCGNSYYHDKFQRDQIEGIHTMKRKYSSLPMSSDHGSHHNHNHSRNHHRSNSQHHLHTVDEISASTTSESPSPKKLAPKPGTEIKLYTLNSTSDDSSFTDVRETSVRATKDDKSVKISIPRSSMTANGSMVADNNPGAWPKSLVLECYRDGEQTILSAFFIYRLN